MEKSGCVRVIEEEKVKRDDLVEYTKEREEVKRSEKDKPCLTKIITPPLACVASRERMPDREWVQSERKPENPGIRIEEEELRLDSWIQIRSTGWDERK